MPPQRLRRIICRKEFAHDYPTDAPARLAFEADDVPQTSLTSALDVPRIKFRSGITHDAPTAPQTSAMVVTIPLKGFATPCA